MLSRPILFDLDGTLTDPKPGITRSIIYALERMGHESLSEDELTWCIGPPIQESFAKILDTEDPAALSKAVGLYRERFTETGLFENEVYPHIRSVLATLRDLGHILYVATSKPAPFAERIVRHFEIHRFFAHVYGSELDGTRSNKAELVAHILHQEGLRSGVMIGDRRQDIDAAQKNQLASIGVLYGYGSQQELTDAGADELAADPADILLALARLPSQ